ncbi:MAG: hypothetical protein IIC57_02000 [Proteobacteria bacterium]|nr:hypothetical protein [Pseudomonadota bacterium]
MTDISPRPTAPKVDLGDFGGRQRPVEIGTLAFDEDGTVEHLPPPSPLDFGFVYREIPFHAALRSEEEKTYLAIEADLGILPYSLEFREKRDSLLDCLALLDRAAPGAILLTRHKRIAYRDEIEIPLALSSVNILAYLTRLLLNAGPYLELLSEPLALSPPSPGEDETPPEGAPETR